MESHVAEADPGMEATNADEADDRWAVVLVHGVGDNEPGSMLMSVTSAMRDASRNGLSIEPYLRRITLPETDPEGNEPAEFPIFMRRGHSARGAVSFAEVYWADLTRVGVDFQHLLMAVLRCVYTIADGEPANTISP
jgi:hypothetical protein